MIATRMTPHDLFVAAIVQYALDCGLAVAEKDTKGSAVSQDIYALGLTAGTRSKAQIVRALTAADDIVRGWRDYLRGEIERPASRFGECYVDPSYLEAA